MTLQLSIRIPRRAEMSTYCVRIGKKLLKTPHKWLLPSTHAVVIITDNRVNKLYGQILQKVLQKKLDRVALISFPAGEKNKNYYIKQMLENKMLAQRFSRDTIIS